MSNSAATDTTTTVGYFNGNHWPIQLVISKLNITLHLQPGEYILDRQGRKVNDPFFEVYASSKQLQRETSDKPVPIVRVPVVASTVTPRHDGHSVRSVTKYKEDAKGVRHPVMPKPITPPEQAVNKPSVIGMSIQEARKAGLARATVEVPEDYGVTDTDGAPIRVGEAPLIKIARDTSRQKVADLPSELVEAVPEQRKELVDQLKKAKSTNESLDSTTGFMNTVIPTAPPNPAVVAGTPTEEFPAPDLDEPPAEDVDVEPPVGADTLLESPPEDEPSPTLKAGKPEVSARDPFVCSVCSDKAFRFRAQLKRHAEQKHPEAVEAVMAPYPATS